MLKNLLGPGFMLNDKPSFSNHVSEGIRHEMLECGGGVGHAEEHDSWFIESTMGDEDSFPLVTFLDMDIVVLPLHIKLSKDLCVF